MNSKVMLLTGGPGTGKTTVIKGIVELYAEIHGLSLDYDDYNEDDYPVVLVLQPDVRPNDFKNRQVLKR